MAHKRTIYGPYRVKNIGVGGDVYEVVEMTDHQSNAWEELRPRYITRTRQAAYGKSKRLNERWQNELYENPDADAIALLTYWREATN